MGKLRFPLNGSDALVDAIHEFLAENVEALHAAMSFPEQDANERVQIDDVTIRAVRVHDDGKLEIDYEYSWSFYAGCKDIDDSGDSTETITARLVGGVIEVDEVERPDPRSTLDEF